MMRPKGSEPVHHASDENHKARLRALLHEAKRLAAEYYTLTGKRLGITGEIGEQAVAELLGWQLVDSGIQKGHDALRTVDGKVEKVQIKTRACANNGKAPTGRMSRINADADCDFVVLVLLDEKNYEPFAMYEAPMAAVCERLRTPGDKGRCQGGKLWAREFIEHCAERIWPKPERVAQEEVAPRHTQIAIRSPVLSNRAASGGEKPLRGRQ
ncbi:hypothetical protein AMST5_02149 [freshwater sediment metagenome]|uniref:Uncharacterized protein n=1 Tax=freshwater sediment metagenome TaxID=556182 RepID=A0AA48M0K3_9ZZZZ